MFLQPEVKNKAAQKANELGYDEWGEGSWGQRMRVFMQPGWSQAGVHLAPESLEWSLLTPV